MTTCLGKSRFTARAFRKLLSIYVFNYFPVGFEGRMWDLLYQFLIIAYLFTIFFFFFIVFVGDRKQSLNV